MRVTGARAALAAAVAAAVVLTALTGCTAGGDDRERTATPTPGRPAPQQTPAAVAVNPADVAGWLVTWAGTGPLTIGGDIAAQGAAIGSAESADDEDDGCLVYELDTQPSHAEPAGTRLTVSTAAPDGRATAVVRIRAVDATDLDRPVTPTPKTSAGIGLGSTLDALQQAYPTLERSNRLPDGQRAYALGDGTGRFVDFVVNDGGFVTELWVASDDRVSSDLCD